MSEFRVSHLQSKYFAVRIEKLAWNFSDIYLDLWVANAKKPKSAKYNKELLMAIQFCQTCSYLSNHQTSFVLTWLVIADLKTFFCFNFE